MKVDDKKKLRSWFALNTRVGPDLVVPDQMFGEKAKFSTQESAPLASITFSRESKALSKDIQKKMIGKKSDKKRGSRDFLTFLLFSSVKRKIERLFPFRAYSGCLRS